MRCEDVSRRLPDYTVGCVGFAARVRMRRHIAACAECRRQLDALNAVSRLVEALPVLEPPASMWDSVVNRIASRKVSVPAPYRLAVWRRAAVLGAAVAVAAAAILAGVRREEVPPGPVGFEAAYVRHHTEMTAADPLSDHVALGTLTLLASWSQPSSDHRH